MIDLGTAELTLGVVGAGAMGAGIAQVALTAGLRVVLLDADPAAPARARDGIRQRLARLAEKGELTADAVEAAMGRLVLAGGIADLAPAAVVVEAIVENLEVKRKLFQEIEGVVAEDAVIASNTSSLPIAAIAKACRHRRRIAGMHFFNPVPVMKLVEIIRAADTAPEVAAGLMALGRRLGRTPVEVKDSPGFLVNLGGRCYTQEALHIVEEGVATPAEVDAVMRECCHFRLGPFELMDLTGIDVNFPVSQIVHEGYFHDPRLKTTPLHRSLADAGRLGRKTGAGFHRYDAAGKRLDEPAPPAPAGRRPARLILPEANDHLVELCLAAGIEAIAHDDGESPFLVAPLGEDATSVALRLGLPSARLVAVDLAFDHAKRLTIMAPPGADAEAVAGVAAVLAATGRAVVRINDSPGFIAQRIVAMIANLGCEMAQMQLASPADIDTAMRLGLNYPLGPLAFAEKLGVGTTYEIIRRIFEATGSDRYRPSLWLRRRALLKLPIATPG